MLREGSTLVEQEMVKAIEEGARAGQTQLYGVHVLADEYAQADLAKREAMRLVLAKWLGEGGDQRYFASYVIGRAKIAELGSVMLEILKDSPRPEYEMVIALGETGFDPAREALLHLVMRNNASPEDWGYGMTALMAIRSIDLAVFSTLLAQYVTAALADKRIGRAVFAAMGTIGTSEELSLFLASTATLSTNEKRRLAFVLRNRIVSAEARPYLNQLMLALWNWP